MPEEEIGGRISEILAEIEAYCIDPRLSSELKGFPHPIAGQNGNHILLDLATPALVSSLDPKEIGVAILDLLGFPSSLWGLARTISHFTDAQTIIDTPLAGLLEGGFQGRHASLYLGGIRYFASHVTEGGLPHIVVLVVNATEEAEVRQECNRHFREADMLTRLARVMTENRGCEQLCSAAACEIVTLAELSAVLIWAADPSQERLDLKGSVGINRNGMTAMRSLKTNASGCFTEIAVSTRQPVLVKSVSDHLLSSQLEATFCYLKPQALFICPLIINDRLLGVVEFIGKSGDRAFADKQHSFEAIAGQLALGLMGAIVEEELKRLESTDSLTGMYHHRSMQQTLHQLVLEGEGGPNWLCAQIIDLDNFRLFNEEQGFDAGDEILRGVAKIIRANTRGSDTTARYGGDKFAVLMPRIELAEAALIGERIRERVSTSTYQSKCGVPLQVTVSIGIADFNQAGGQSTNLLKSAENALTAAKDFGRNRVQIFDGSRNGIEIVSAAPLENYQPWFSRHDWETANSRLSNLAPELSRFGSALHLNGNQIGILRALVLMAPLYKLAKNGDPVLFHKLERVDEMRPLLPSLSRLDDRFDASGDAAHGLKRTPLLAKILQILLALEAGEDLKADLGKYDPQIIHLALSQHLAA